MTYELRPTDPIGPAQAVSMPEQTSRDMPAGLLASDRLEIGDPAAPFILPDPAGTQWSPLDNDIAGKPLLLLFHIKGTDAVFLRDLQPFIAAHDKLQGLGCRVFALTRTGIAGLVSRALPASPDGKPLWPILTDAQGDVFQNYGMTDAASSLAEGRPTTIALLLNANMKIAYIGASPQTLQHILDELQQMARDRPPTPLSSHPPILIVPLALSARDCDFLVQRWHRLDQQHGATGHSEVDPKCVAFLREYGRVNQYLIEEPSLLKALDAKLARRLMPEIGKAFDTRAPQREAWALSCYDVADGGMLGPHRDCASEETRHRRFTISVALNDTYQGGALRFREYGEQTYNLPVGAATVFSAALLHEVLPITAGQRLALVTHLYGK